MRGGEGRRGDQTGTSAAWEREMEKEAMDEEVAVRGAPVESAGAEEGGVEDVATVRRANHDDAGVALEAVHLGEDLRRVSRGQ